MRLTRTQIERMAEAVQNLNGATFELAEDDRGGLRLWQVQLVEKKTPVALGTKLGAEGRDA